MAKRNGGDRKSGMTIEDVRERPALFLKIYLGWASGESYSGLEQCHALRRNEGNTAWRCCRLLEKNHRVRKQSDRSSEKVRQLVLVLRAPAATMIEGIALRARVVLVKSQELLKTDLPKCDVTESQKTCDYRGASGWHENDLRVFMFFHGGGWVLGDYPTHERFVRNLVVGSGAAAVFVNYTPSPEAQYPVGINWVSPPPVGSRTRRRNQRRWQTHGGGLRYEFLHSIFRTSISHPKHDEVVFGQLSTFRRSEIIHNKEELFACPHELMRGGEGYFAVQFQ